DGAQRGQDRAQVAAVAATDNGDRRRINTAVPGQQVVRGEHVAQVVAARDRLVLRLRLRVAPEVERQAHAAQGGDLSRPGQVLLLAAAPAVYEEHPRDRTVAGRGQQRAGDVLAIDRDVESFIGH